jgi:UDP-N-acetylmuramoyl-tripeptide--D-alanyl-D-alanine ligase
VAEAAIAMGGTVTRGEGGREWTRAAIDSRQVAGGELFFALAGTRADGHDFVADALARGAAAAVVEREPSLPADRPSELPSTGALIRVPKVYDALHALTRVVRREVPERLVGITGSSGKTTTKELLALCLGRRFRVAKSPGNLNNLLGFPLTLLATATATEWLVAEMGMSAPGELAEISRLARPDVAVFTNVRPVHLEGLGGLAEVAAAKAELLAGLVPGGLVVANADDEHVRAIAARHQAPGRTVWFSARGDAAAGYRLADLAARGDRPGTRFRLLAPDDEVEIELPLHGAYNAENFLAAAATAHALGVPLEELPAAAAEAVPVGGRGAVHALPIGATLVDDSYNSNPVALRRALESARALPGLRYWAVLGDMLELGPEGPRYHRAEGEAAAALGFAPVCGVGELARPLVDGAAAGGAATRWFPGAAEAAAWAAGELRAGDVVLVKGSRGVRLEQVVTALRAAGEGRG